VLRNSKGVSVRIISLGATVQSLEVPDRNGRRADVVLGYASASDYLSKSHLYFGATAGRYAGRIAKGRFSLDSNSYQLALNDPPNSLHGGVTGFDRVLWTIVELYGGALATVQLRYISKDGEEGYPGHTGSERDVCAE
jgi:aldose 1-epimerase